ncbi:MAG: alpha-L-rhamnosidase C-terminal domain-containing protein, partial [Terrimicrobiaceae bacterium]
MMATIGASTLVQAGDVSTGATNAAVALTHQAVAVKDEALAALHAAGPVERRYELNMDGASVAQQPYPVLNGGTFDGPVVKDSPDPLVAYRWKETKAEDGMQVYALRPVAAVADTDASFNNLASSTGGKTDIAVMGTGSIRFDFGVESAAWLEMDSSDLGDAGNAVEMSISEYNEPGIVNPMPKHPVKTFVPVRHGSTYRLELNDLLFEGARFGWIHVRRWDKPWHISGVRLVCQAKPVNYNGAFSCSDEKLTRIWYTGAYGIRVNFRKDYICASLMDRGDRYSWTGDAHTTQAGALVAFGNVDFIRHNIQRTSKDFNGIKTYALYWVLSVLDYYQYTGDAGLLRQYADEAVRRCIEGNGFYDQPSKLGYVGSDERLGGCFENPDCEEGRNTYRMLLLRTCQELSTALERAGYADVAAPCRAILDRRVAELRRDPDWPDKFALFSLSEAASAFANPEECRRIAVREYSHRVGRLALSPFNQYFVLLGMAKTGNKEEALTTVRDLWGGMIDYGATTFLEAYRPSWNPFLNQNDPVPNGTTGWTSLAHAWGGGVCKWLTEEVLGIKPTSPGFKTYQVRPFLGGTLTSVRGTVPTILGPISARFDLKRGEAEVVAPEGTLGSVAVPKCGRTIRSIRINDQLAWDGTFHPAAGISSATNETDAICLTGIPGGRYTLAIDYGGTAPLVKEEPLRFAAAVLPPDEQTQGNWNRAYGKDGYSFCGLKIQQLPDFVASLKTTGMEEQWRGGDDDPRAFVAVTPEQRSRQI